jgi:hypothetical protein
LIVPQPVTTPSPRGLDFSIPKSTQRWVTNMSYSSKLPSSSNSSIRSRAVSLPLACCAVDALLRRRQAAPRRADLELCEDVLHGVLSLPSGGIFPALSAAAVFPRTLEPVHL